MSSLTLRRIFVWVVSMLLGFALTALFITLVLHRLVASGTGEPVTLQKYGQIYFLVTAIPIGLIFVCWLDYFMDTRILPD
jgi:hypothetical protein